ncbi:MAG: DUF4386 family protein [Thermoleophilaceae bacterium]
MLLGGNLLQVSALSSPSSDEKDDAIELLRAIDANTTEFVGAGVVQALSYLALAGVLFYLYRAVKHRRPELPQILLALVIAAPVLKGVADILLDMARVDSADQLVSSAPAEQTENRAEDLLDEPGAFVSAFGSAATLLLAVALVMLNVNAMRVGIVSRFLGVLGIVIAVLFAFPLGASGILQVFWLVALVGLFLDRWPGGRGPAWESGEAVPWPSAAERRGLVPPREGEEGEGETGAELEPEAEDPDRPRPKKRKRKRRR